MLSADEPVPLTGLAQKIEKRTKSDSIVRKTNNLAGRCDLADDRGNCPHPVRIRIGERRPAAVSRIVRGKADETHP